MVFEKYLDWKEYLKDIWSKPGLSMQIQECPFLQ